MRILKSNRPLRRLLGAWAQSCVGAGAGYVALLLVAYRDLHTSWAVTAVLLAEFVPVIAFGSWFGALADRHSRRVLIVAANLLQAGAYGGLAASHTAAPIVSLALLAGVGTALQRPAMRAALPVVAGEARQVAAAWYDTCRWFGLTVGPLVAASLFAISGTSLPLALNALGYAVAAAVLSTVAVGTPSGSRHAQAPPDGGVRAGLAVAFAVPAITSVIACSAGAVIAGGVLNVCEPILATRVLHGSGSDYALLVTVYGVGMVAASALVARRGDMPSRVLINRYLAAIALLTLGLAASSIAGNIATATVAFAGTGFANALLLVSAAQLIQLRVDNSVQGRLFGAKDTIEGAAFVLGLVAGGALVAAIGVRLTLAGAAGVCGVGALATVAGLRGAIRAAAAAVYGPAAETAGPAVVPAVDDSPRSA